jgi:hypothetical protein
VICTTHCGAEFGALPSVGSFRQNLVQQRKVRLLNAALNLVRVAGGDTTTMAYLGIALNLIGIGLELNPYFQNAWLAMLCVFFGGGFFFLGIFGRRQAVDGQSLLDRINPATFNIIATTVVIMGLLFLSDLGRAIYTIAQREVDIQAAKAGISTPSAIPTATAKDKAP